MFEHMEISESIYKIIVEPSYKTHIQTDANRAGHSRQNRGEVASPWTCPEKGESAGKHRKQHVESPTGKSKNCLIHDPGNYSEECKVLRDFGTTYANSRPAKDRGSSSVPREKLTVTRKTTPSLITQWMKLH